MTGIPVLTIEDVATLDGVLGDFLKKAEAELTVVIDRGGNVISQFGDRNVTDVTIIAALAAGSFAATRELARRIGEVEPALSRHQKFPSDGAFAVVNRHRGTGHRRNLRRPQPCGSTTDHRDAFQSAQN